MLNKQKLLLVIFFLLLFVTIFEIVYYFYFQTPQNTYQPTNLIQASPTPISSIPQQNQLQGEEYLLSLIPKAKKEWTNYTDGIKNLKQIQPKECVLTSNCVEINNKGSGWNSQIATFSAVPISGPFVVRLSLQNKNDLSGVSFSGRLKSPGSLWWQDIKNIFIGLKNNGSTLYVDAKDGTSENPYILFDKKLDKKTASLNIFFDNKGKRILITDEEYQLITYLDLNIKSGNRFPDGLFPENKMYAGYTVAAKSYLAVLEFLIMPIAD